MKKLLYSCCASLLLLAGVGAETAADAPPADASSSYVNFSFDQADIRLLVKLVGDMTGKRFLMDDSVSGKVSVVTPGRIPLDEVYPLLLTILESSGYSVVESRAGYRVVPLPDRSLSGVPVVATDETGPQHGLITKVIRIEHVNVVELKKLLEPLVRGGKAGAIAAFASTGHLIITDTVDNIAQVEKIIADVDRPGAARLVEVIRLKYASADEVARQLIAAMRGTTTAGEKVGRYFQQVGEGLASLPSDIVVVPATHANSIVVVGTPAQLQEIRQVVALVDVEAPTGYGRLNVLFLKYLNAEEAAKNLNDLLAKTVEKDQRNPIAIEHNVANNALIIDAAPQDYEVVRKLVEDLDKAPQQVMVEVLIVELTMGKNLDLGVEMNTIDAPKEGSYTAIGRTRLDENDPLLDFVQQGVFPRGIAVGVARGSFVDSAGRVIPRVPILIRALEQNRDVKILSKPVLWAQNNKEASVSVVDNIPLLRSTVEGGAGTSRDIIQNIDRVDVGIKLKLTPHINPDQEVTLQLNPSIEAIVDPGPRSQNGAQFAPTIAKREASTTITVPDRSTVIISGLIREDSIKSVSKVPLLGDLPLLGWLFRSTSTRTQRTNLLIFVTPHIVTDVKQALALKKSLEETTGLDAAAVLKAAPEPSGE